VLRVGTNETSQGPFRTGGTGGTENRGEALKWGGGTRAGSAKVAEPWARAPIKEIPDVKHSRRKARKPKIRAGKKGNRLHKRRKKRRQSQWKQRTC